MGLTDVQIGLINTHYNKILEGVRRLCVYKFHNSRCDIDNIIDEIMSLLPLVTLEFKPGKNKDFVQFAILRCFLRFIDGLRKSDPLHRKRGVVAAVKKTLDYMPPGCLEDDMIVKVQEDHPRILAKNIPRYLGLARSKRVNIATLLTHAPKRSSNWDHTKQTLLREVSTRFKKDPIHTSIILHYVIPKCEGQKAVPIWRLAKKLGCCKSKLLRAMRDSLTQECVLAALQD